MICHENECKKRAYYGRVYGEKPEFCPEHGKKRGFINVHIKRCIECNITATYGIHGERPKYCTKHGKERGLTNIVTKRCLEKGCPKQPIFGQVTGKAIYCATHGRKRGFVDVLNKRCTEKECIKRAIFGKSGERPKYCSDHGKKRGFINVNSKRCSQEGCMKQNPNFGPPGKKGTHCYEHKEKDYVDVTHIKCKENGCNIRAIFGPIGGKSMYCSVHGTNLGYIDIANKKCKSMGCTIRATFGQKNGTAEYCSVHGTKLGYTDIANKKCKSTGCTVRATFGQENGKAEYCAEHGNEKGFNDIISKRCLSSACSVYKNNEKPFATRINPENGKREMCSNCWRVMYPELSKRKVRKEQFILAEVQHQIPELGDYFLTWDCKIPGQSCVAFRPDMAWEINDTLLHIEIDEDGINHEDDDQRLAEIHSASNKKNHVCIRFNPDKSINGSPPCMKKITLKNGESVYNKDPKEWDRRMNKLIPELRNAYEDALVNKSVCGKRKLCF